MGLEELEQIRWFGVGKKAERTDPRALYHLGLGREKRRPNSKGREEENQNGCPGGGFFKKNCFKKEGGAAFLVLSIDHGPGLSKGLEVAQFSWQQCSMSAFQHDCVCICLLDLDGFHSCAVD